MSDSWNKAALKRWIVTDSRWKMNDPSWLSPDTSLILWPRSSKKWYAEWFVEPKVSMAIGRKVYTKWMSAYFWQQRIRDHLSMSTGCSSDIRVCQGAHN